MSFDFIHFDELDPKRCERKYRKSLRKAVLSRYQGQCLYCGDIVDNPTLDHVIPKSKGGTHSEDNLINACQQCNVQKSDKSWLTWYQSKPFYCEDRLSVIQEWIV